jgi:hypothetical protein
MAAIVWIGGTNDSLPLEYYSYLLISKEVENPFHVLISLPIM